LGWAKGQEEETKRHIMEESAIGDVHMLFAAGTTAVNITGLRDCQIMLEMNSGFSITF
jgi:hypothetical protein